jgi:hypothetical protein
MLSPFLGQASVHCEQKIHELIHIRILFVSGNTSIAWEGQTLAQSVQPVQASRS